MQNPETKPEKPLSFAAECEALRAQLGLLEKSLLALRDHPEVHVMPALPPGDGPNVNEVLRNLALARTHCEDVRLRLGKVIQYAETQISKYDQK